MGSWKPPPPSQAERSAPFQMLPKKKSFVRLQPLVSDRSNGFIWKRIYVNVQTKSSFTTKAGKLGVYKCAHKYTAAAAATTVCLSVFPAHVKVKDVLLILGSSIHRKLTARECCCPSPSLYLFISATACTHSRSIRGSISAQELYWHNLRRDSDDSIEIKLLPPFFSSYSSDLYS